MKINEFGVEEWLNVWENDAIYDIAGSSIASMTLEEILELNPADKENLLNELLQKKMNYGWIEDLQNSKKKLLNCIKLLNQVKYCRPMELLELTF